LQLAVAVFTRDSEGRPLQPLKVTVAIAVPPEERISMAPSQMGMADVVSPIGLLEGRLG
jgi:hypothetical protein